MQFRVRPRQTVRQMDTPMVRVLSVKEMELIKAELERAQECGDPLESARIIQWVETFRDAYFRDRHGNLRRCMQEAPQTKSQKKKKRKARFHAPTVQ